MSVLIVVMAYTIHLQFGRTDELARPVPNWTYKTLEQQSTLVVIVEAISTRNATDADKITPLKGMEEQVRGVITQFRVLSTLKGSVDSKEISIQHFHELAGRSGFSGNGPCFVDFKPYIIEPKSSQSRLPLILYLRMNESGSFNFTTGSIDPIFSVKQLQSLPLQWPESKQD